IGDAHWVSQEEYDAIARYSRLDEVRATLMSDYYQELDEDQLVLGAIRGMTESIGDPYTFYYTPEEMSRANEDTLGLYHGIGVLIQSSDEGYIQVLRVYPDTPAEEAGLRVGDLIIGVDGTAISGEDGRTYNDAVNMIRGEDGTLVTLTLRRSGVTFDVPVMRADVNVSYADYRVLPGNIGYISISQFTGDAADRFQQAIDEFRAQNVAGMVIDLRNNPGGLLDQVVRIADSLLPTGVIVYIKDRDGTRMDYYSDESMYDVPLAVLVNDMSASASEILAASVQAFGRGVIVGLPTYGKGIVQTLLTYDSDGAGLQLTTSSYYDAEDRSIHGVGVQPDVEVALTAERIPMDPDPAGDNQLAAAIEAVNRQIEAREEAH
ncbi:MAG: S41 family peptidase, partial [Clostridia bacterium]|nr:S41 family peptidase [Clostridia bacterium]